MGEYKKALPLYKKSLKIREDILGVENPDTATSYNNLAGLYESMGEYKKALPLYKKSLKIREDILGVENPDTATSYNNLAGLYESMGEYKKALPLYKKSLDVFKEIFGEKHPTTIIIYKNIALFYKTIKQEDKIGVLFEEFMNFDVKLDVPLKIENSLLLDIAKSISLSIDEKEKILNNYDKLSEFHISELEKIFQEERDKWLELVKSKPDHFGQLVEKFQPHIQDWNNLVEKLNSNKS